MVSAAFHRLQRERLLEAWRADRQGSGAPHTIVGLPSYSVDRTVLEHYGARIGPLEGRYLYVLLTAARPDTKVVYLSSLPVEDEVLRSYLDLADVEPDELLSRVLLVSPDDVSPRPLAEKLLDRGDLIDAVRRFGEGAPMFLEPWNVTDAEAELAVVLGAPLYGTAPELRAIATKSNGRRLFREVGVPLPAGVEDVTDAAGVVAAIAALQRDDPELESVIVKLDDSVAGDGNITVHVGSLPHDREGRLAIADAIVALDASLPDWYREVLGRGGVVEERISGGEFRSPSVQASVTPVGDIEVLATHEQRLGGPDGQIFEGCTFPADVDYAPALAAHATAVGRRLAELGALGRFSVDFAARRRPSGTWEVFALEINLRKGGTTHPYGVTRLLTGGTYDGGRGVFSTPRGETVCYGATDNLVDPSWVGRTPADVRQALAASELGFDRARLTGVVPHLLDCLRVDGRMGYTAIGRHADEVAELEARVAAALGLDRETAAPPGVR